MSPQHRRRFLKAQANLERRMYRSQPRRLTRSSQRKEPRLWEEALTLTVLMLGAMLVLWL